VVRVAPDLDDATIYIVVQARSGGGLVYGTYQLNVRNGSSQGIRATVAPASFVDRVEVFTVATPTGFTDILAAFVGATLAVRNSAVETALIAAGLMPAGAVS
jgi:hypothetical protein